MLRQGLSQKQLQKLSPQQIQLMKLLQIPTANLEQRIEEEMEANPALEESLEKNQEHEDQHDQTEEDSSSDEEIDLSDYFDDDDPVADYQTYDKYSVADEEEGKSIPYSAADTFQEYLREQVGLLKISDERKRLALQIVGSIDEDGYLRRDIEALEMDLVFSQNISTNKEDLVEMLERVQGFDPAGVGARDLRECLLIQLKRKKERNIYVNLAQEIIEKEFETFSKKHYERLKKTFNIDQDLLKKALDEILKLNPKPGSTHANQSKIHTYITPDFIIENIDDELQLKLNSRNAPELRVSSNFKEMLQAYNVSKEKSKKDKEAILFIKQKIDGAKWFIEAIRQRQATLMNTMRAIMEYQYDFFLSGDETKLKPMILKNIADITNLDISTVSRVANSKYVQTEFGTYLIKFFFSESLSTESGEEVSTREVKKILQDLIDNEEKKKPLSDQKLTDTLNEKGYNIARRTVAKYREQLNIPVARLRKKLV